MSENMLAVIIAILVLLVAYALSLRINNTFGAAVFGLYSLYLAFTLPQVGITAIRGGNALNTLLKILVIYSILEIVIYLWKNRDQLGD